MSGSRGAPRAAMATVIGAVTAIVTAAAATAGATRAAARAATSRERVSLPVIGGKKAGRGAPWCPSRTISSGASEFRPHLTKQEGGPRAALLSVIGALSIEHMFDKM